MQGPLLASVPDYLVIMELVWDHKSATSSIAGNILFFSRIHGSRFRNYEDSDIQYNLNRYLIVLLVHWDIPALIIGAV